MKNMHIMPVFRSRQSWEPTRTANFDANWGLHASMSCGLQSRQRSCCFSNYLSLSPHVVCLILSQFGDLWSKASSVWQISTGLGRSKSAEAPAAVGELAPAGFLKEVCERLSLSPVVVISPSLSGMYSLPFLHQHQALIRAYIPVAPICTDKFTAEQYKSVKVPSYRPLLYIPV